MAIAIDSASANVGGYCQLGKGNWDKTAKLTGNGPDDVVAVAEKQLGKGKSDLGYTGDWCAAFVNDVFKLAEQGSAAPFVSGKTHGVVGLRSEVLSKGGTTVSASAKKKGDLIFYYCTKCGCYVHVGICYDNGNTRIEGNVGNVVKKHTGGYQHYWENSKTGASGLHKESAGEVTISYVRPNYSNKNYGYLDVNGCLDGVDSGSLGAYGTFDIKAGSTTKNDVSDYNGRLEKGTAYEITDIKANPGYEYLGVQKGSTKGTITSIDTIDVRLIFATQGRLHVQGNLDGVPDDSVADYGTFDVYIGGSKVAANCTSFNQQFPNGTAYEIRGMKAANGKNYDGLTIFKGTIKSNTEAKVVLPYSSKGTATPDWQVGKAVPGNLARETLDIEYKYTYTQQARTSPGAEWTLVTEGPLQYENDGAQYQSDNELSTSATRVLVGYYYFHYCNNGTLANYYKKDYLPIKHTIGMADAAANYTVQEKGTDGDGSGRKYYHLIHKSGQWAGGIAKCGTNGSQVYYRGGVYQNMKAYRVNTYQKVSDWTTVYDASATSTSVRWRLKDGVSTEYKGIQLNFLVDGESVASLEGIADLNIFVNGEQKAFNATTYRAFFPGEFSYSIEIDNVAVDKLYQGIDGGELNGMVNEELKTLTLRFVTGVQAEENWKVIPEKLLPYLDEHSEIEYRHTYTQKARTSPGDGWTLVEQGAVQYENDGAQYESDNELSTSATRVLVGYYYFHWCNNGKTANYYKKDYLPIKHTISMASVNEFTISENGTDGDGSGRKVYKLVWKSGQWAGGVATCGTNGSSVYYRGGVYQNKKEFRINTYSKTSEWTTTLDTSAASVEYRIRLKQYPVTIEPCGGNFSIESLTKYDGIALILPMEIPVRDMYEFVAWNTEPDGTGTTYNPGDAYQANEDTYLYARWKEAATLNLPEGLTTIDAEAFANVSALRIRVPASCTEIRSKAFLNCNNLRAIHIPATTVTIALDAFDGCPNLTIYAPAGSEAIRVARYNYIPYVEE